MVDFWTSIHNMIENTYIGSYILKIVICTSRDDSSKIKKDVMTYFPFGRVLISSTRKAHPRVNYLH